jgi:hypothetical protein
MIVVTLALAVVVVLVVLPIPIAVLQAERQAAVPQHTVLQSLVELLLQLHRQRSQQQLC